MKIEALSRNAVSTHATAVAEVCRSRWISGSAGATRDCSRAYVAAAEREDAEGEAVVLAVRSVAGNVNR